MEWGRGHYPAMVALHAGLLVSCLAEVWLLDRPFLPRLGWPALAAVLACEAGGTPPAGRAADALAVPTACAAGLGEALAAVSAP